MIDNLITVEASHVSSEILRGWPTDQGKEVTIDPVKSTQEVDGESPGIANDKEADSISSIEGVPKDRSGNLFNPDIHKTSIDGQPLFNPDGTIKMKPGSGGPYAKGISDRKTEPEPPPVTDQEPQPRPELNIPAPEPEPEIKATETQIRQAAKMTATMLITVGKLIDGPEWSPRKGTFTLNGQQVYIDEFEELESTFYRYYKATNTMQPPPWLDLTIGLGVYVIPRFQAPQTKSFFAKWRDRFKVFIFKRRERNAARANSRDDDIRKNDSSEATEPGFQPGAEIDPRL